MPRLYPHITSTVHPVEIRQIVYNFFFDVGGLWSCSCRLEGAIFQVCNRDGLFADALARGYDNQTSSSVDLSRTTRRTVD